MASVRGRVRPGGESEISGGDGLGGGTAEIEVDGFSCSRRKVEGIDSRGIN